MSMSEHQPINPLFSKVFTDIKDFTHIAYGLNTACSVNTADDLPPTCWAFRVTKRGRGTTSKFKTLKFKTEGCV